MTNLEVLAKQEELMKMVENLKEKLNNMNRESSGEDFSNNVQHDGCIEICLIDVLSSEKDSVLEKVESNLQIKQLYNKICVSLSEREGEIVKMRYGLIDGRCRTQREIAALLGISRSYVSRIEKKALKKLKKELSTK